MKSSLIHMIYASFAVDEPSPATLRKLLETSRTRNERDDLTGMLLLSDGSFFQVLEGEPAVVDATFARICRDPRHSGIVTIIRERIPERAFAAWTMGYVADSQAEIETLAGANDFFAGSICFDRLPHGRAKKLLSAFRNGRWRKSDIGDARRFA